MSERPQDPNAADSPPPPPAEGDRPDAGVPEGMVPGFEAPRADAPPQPQPQPQPPYQPPQQQQPATGWTPPTPEQPQGAYPPAPGYGYAPPPGPDSALAPQNVGGYPAQDPYATGAWGYAGPQEHPQTTTVLVLGIVGLFVGGLTSPFAWWMGHKARREVQADPQRYTSPTTLTIGWVLGILGTVYLAFLIAMLAFMIIVLGLALFA